MDEYNDTQSGAVDMEVISGPSAIEQSVRAEVDIQIETAKRYPRKSLEVIRNRIMTMACATEETAESCFYSLERWDKKAGEKKFIIGPSIRMAEIAANAWGNLRVASRVAHTDIKSEDAHVVVTGICHDLETNVAIMQDNRRRIFKFHDKKTGKTTVNEDAITLATNSAASFAIRNAVLRVIPRAFIQGIMDQARKVAAGGAEAIEERRQKIFSRLQQRYGVDQARALAAIGKTAMSEVGDDELVTLIGLGTSVKDEVKTIEEAFPPLTPPAPTINMPPTTAATPPNVDHAPSAAATPEAKPKRASKPKVAATPEPATPEPQQSAPEPTPAATAPEPETPPPAAHAETPREVLMGYLMDIGATIQDLSSALVRLSYDKQADFRGCATWELPDQIGESAATRMKNAWGFVLKNEVLRSIAARGNA